MQHDPKPCQRCGTEFVPKYRTGRFCSPRCAQAAREAITPKRECAWPTCKDDARYGLPLCGMHWRRQQTGIPMDQPKRGRDIRPCIVEGCERKHQARGYCQMHYFRVLKYGEPGAAEPQRAANGEGWTNAEGYRASRRGGRGRKAVLEHRAAMERLLSRPLTKLEQVHHINGVRHDNTTNGPLDSNFRSGNLELWSKSHPSGQRVADKVAWAAELLAQYAPHMLAGVPNESR